MRTTLLLASLSIATACSGIGRNIGQVTLTDAGARVQASPNAPGTDCRNKGTIIGETEGASTTSAGEHTRRALDDARNKAAQIGANYIQTTAPQLTQSKYGPTGATVMATAFACDGQAPVAPAPTEPSPRS
jgi:hypothetical protein